MVRALKVKDGRIEAVEVGDFRDIQAQIGCRCFTVPFSVGDEIGVFADDEALLVDQPKLAVVLDETFISGGYVLFGESIMLIGADDEGGSRSLTDEEIASFKISAQPHVVRAQGVIVESFILSYRPKVTV